MATIFCRPTATGANDGTSWEDGYTSFQAAIYAAGAGDEVWVTEGTITLSAYINVSNVNDPDIYGGFAAALTGTSGSVAGRTAGAMTTLDGVDTYKCLSYDVWEGTIDGFKLLNGYNSGLGGGMTISRAGTYYITNCEFNSCVSGSDGGALACSDAVGISLTINNCLFTGNSADDGGAVYSKAPSLTIIDTEFSDNSSSGNGGALYAANATITISGCTFDTNTSASHVGGLYMNTCDFTISDTVFSNCTAPSGWNGAVRSTSGDGSYENCYFDTNSSTRGGHIYLNLGTVTAVNCVFVGGSSTTTAGAVYIDTSGVFVPTDCTFADNECTTADSGGAIFVRNAGETLTAVNCQFWGNTANSVANQIDTEGGATISVTYSNIEGGYTGTGNVNDDPLFKGTGDDPYDLSATSDSVDSGNSGATDYPTLDYLGRARYDDPGTTNTGTGTPAYSDMGAYEFQGATSTPKRSLLFAIN